MNRDNNKRSSDNNRLNDNYNGSGQGYDEFQRQYEEQLRRFAELDNSSPDEYQSTDELEFEQYDLNRQAQNGRRTPTPGNTPRRTSQNSNRGSANSGQKRTSQSRARSSSGQGKGRNEPLKFGDRNKEAKNKSYKKAPAKNSGYSKSKKSNKKKKAEKNNMNKEKRSSPVKTFFKCLLILILVLFILLQLLIFRYLGMVNYVETGGRSVNSASMSSDDVLNVLIIGSDTRDEDERGRTDSMILLSVNKATKQITMTSFMRDMYVEIPGNGWNKMNAAYVYGGAELLMDTIELNFDIDVDKYIYIDFYSFIDIVDAVGGIELDISDEEAEGMKDPMAEQNKYLGNEKGTDYLTSGGKGVTVNGNQALAYARLRYVGNADFERTERQRTVISKIIEKSKTLNPFELDGFARTCLSNLTTNMTKSELYFLTYRAPFILGYDMQQLRIPLDDAYSYGTTNSGQSILEVDFDRCREEIGKTIYGY
ncbi:LCP family protein [Ruminococcus sp. Marseille-P6503]|uniref:LCP family protein n=1 Tax=Ruminococcus sp. Marseille-P6503 TaxID=2364796 RepID=UPI000F538C4E|nr:LCP family protein [Ruminococcus sp. Marseille-P6503]